MKLHLFQSASLVDTNSNNSVHYSSWLFKMYWQEKEIHAVVPLFCTISFNLKLLHMERHSVLLYGIVPIQNLPLSLPASKDNFPLKSLNCISSVHLPFKLIVSIERHWLSIYTYDPQYQRANISGCNLTCRCYNFPFEYRFALQFQCHVFSYLFLSKFYNCR